jgi:putative phage-type endonuclease
MSSLELIPNTPEWLEARKEYIGASDAPVIMGVSPYSTPYQLWQKKLGLLEETQTFAMARGHSLESQARAQVEERLGILLTPKVKTHSSLNWMMATLDGLSADGKTLVEIKCPAIADHMEALQGRIPLRYSISLRYVRLRRDIIFPSMAKKEF